MEGSIQNNARSTRPKTLEEISMEIETIASRNEDHHDTIAELVQTNLLPERDLMILVDECHVDESGDVDVHRFKECFLQSVRNRFQKGEYNHLVVNYSTEPVLEDKVITEAKSLDEERCDDVEKDSEEYKM